MKSAVEWLVKEINKINVSPEARRFISKLEKQAKEIENEQQDAFAIGFAEWCIDEENNVSYYKRLGKSKELLEIYKKEKGL